MKKNLIISGAFMTVILLGLSFVDSGVDQNTQVSRVRNIFMDKETRQNIEVSKEQITYTEKLGIFSGLGKSDQNINFKNLRNTDGLVCGSKYIVGGVLGQPFLPSTNLSYYLNPIHNNWIELPETPFVDSRVVSTTIWDDNILALSQDYNTFPKNIWSFDGIIWEQFDNDTNTPGIQDTPSYISNITSYQGKLWSFGGYYSNEKDVWVFDPVVGVWEEFDNDPSTPGIQKAPWEERNPGGLYEFQGKLWIIGGTYFANPNDTTTSTHYDIWSFDGTSWEEIDNDPNTPGIQDFEPYLSFAKKAVKDDALWFVMAGSVSDTIQVFDGVNWSLIDILPDPAIVSTLNTISPPRQRSHLTTTKKETGNLMMIGGLNIITGQNPYENFNDVWVLENHEWSKVDSDLTQPGIQNAQWSTPMYPIIESTDDCISDLAVTKNVYIDIAGNYKFKIKLFNNGQVQENYYIRDVVPGDVKISSTSTDVQNVSHGYDNNTGLTYNLAYFNGVINPGQELEFYVVINPRFVNRGFNNIVTVYNSLTPPYTDQNPTNDMFVLPVTILENIGR